MRLREMWQKSTFEQGLVCSADASMCPLFFPSVIPSLPGPTRELGGETPVRILTVVSPGPRDCGLSAKLHWCPAQGLLQQPGHPQALLRARHSFRTARAPSRSAGPPVGVEPSALYPPRPADQLHDPHFLQVSIITLLAQNTAVWQRQAADVKPGPQLRLAAASSIPRTHSS